MYLSICHTASNVDYFCEGDGTQSDTATWVLCWSMSRTARSSCSWVHLVYILSSMESTCSHLRTEPEQILCFLIGDCMPNHCKIFCIKDHHTPKNTPSPNSIKRKHLKVYTSLPKTDTSAMQKFQHEFKMYIPPFVSSHCWNFLKVVILVKPPGGGCNHSTAASICFTKRQVKGPAKGRTFWSGGTGCLFDARDIFFQR